MIALTQFKWIALWAKLKINRIVFGNLKIYHSLYAATTLTHQ